MKKTKLYDGTEIFCISATEGQMLYEHINGYLEHGSIVIKEGDTIVDVGANIGVFGIKLSKILSDIEIFSFEPIEPIYNILKKNAQITKNSKFNVFPWGISDKNEHIECTYYPNSPALSTVDPGIWDSSGKDLLSALSGNLANAPKNWWWAKYIPRFIYPYIVWRLRKNPQLVKCQLHSLSNSIDRCQIKKIDLLKIDCEGNELKVLKGIKESDWSIIKQLIIEVHDIDDRLNHITDMMKDRNYNVEIVKEPSLEGVPLYNLYAQR